MTKTKTQRALIVSTTVLTLLLSLSSASGDEKTYFSGINKLTFMESKYDKAFVGNGFLVHHQGKSYAVTVKHALLEARTPKLTSVDIAAVIKHWEIHPNQLPDQKVVLGALLNANPAEPLDMNILDRDWLVFEIAENTSELKPLKIRETPLQSGENVIAIGCTYQNVSNCNQNRYSGTFLQYENGNLRVQLDGDLDPFSLRGLSGSPVLDARHQLVGIVSNVLPKEQGNGFDFAPATTDYLREVLRKVERDAAGA